MSTPRPTFANLMESGHQLCPAECSLLPSLALENFQVFCKEKWEQPEEYTDKVYRSIPPGARANANLKEKQRKEKQASGVKHPHGCDGFFVFKFYLFK